MKTKSKNITAQFVYLFFFANFFQVTFYGIIGYVVAALSLALLVVSTRMSSCRLMKEDTRVILSFFVVQFWGFIIAPVMCALYGSEYLDFFSSTGGRVFNLVFNALYIILLIGAINGQHVSMEKAEKYFVAGCLFLVFFGYWQLAHNLFGVPFPDIGTRSSIHSVNLDSSLLRGRITSLVQEPSYFIRYLAEPFIIIFFSSAYRHRKIKLLMIVVILFFTLSLSGYVNFLLILCYIFWLRSNRLKKFGALLLVGMFVLIVLFFSINIWGGVIFTVLSRLKPSDLLESSRLQEIYVPLKHQLDSFNLLGSGFKGYVFVAGHVRYLFGWLAGKSVADGSVTSHFLLVDMFIEYGILGLFAMLFFFVHLYKKTMRIYRVHGFATPNVLLVNYFISNMFVVDYASFHSVIIISLLLFYCKKCPVCMRINPFSQTSYRSCRI